MENEFPEHIVETEQCLWEAKTPAGDYHLMALDLNERSHIKRRYRRKLLFENLDRLEKNAFLCASPVHPEALKALQVSIEALRSELTTAVPFATASGLVDPSSRVGTASASCA